MWPCWDSNFRHVDLQSDALPAALWSPAWFSFTFTFSVYSSPLGFIALLRCQLICIFYVILWCVRDTYTNPISFWSWKWQGLEPIIFDLNRPTPNRMCVCSKHFYKSIAGRCRPVSYPDGPITARYRFIKNAYWVEISHHLFNNSQCVDYFDTVSSK